jgi:hypothetical protein
MRLKLTQEQCLDIARNALQAAGSVLTTYGGLTANTWGVVTGIVLMFVPIVWGLIINAQENLEASAVAMVAALPQSSVDPTGRTIQLLDPKLQAIAKSTAESRPLNLYV